MTTTQERDEIKRPTQEEREYARFWLDNNLGKLPFAALVLKCLDYDAARIAELEAERDAAIKARVEDSSARDELDAGTKRYVEALRDRAEKAEAELATRKAPVDDRELRGFVTRLRERVEGHFNEEEKYFGTRADPDCTQAADLIEHLSASVATAEAMVENMRKVLRSVQWGATSHPHQLDACPSCHALMPIHEKNCSLKAAIASAPPAPVAVPNEDPKPPVGDAVVPSGWKHIAGQHIGWLMMYVGTMTEGNWRDMRDAIQRQTRELSDHIEAAPTPPAGETPREAPHEWVESKLGHGETMCRRCLMTNREAAVLGALNHCEKANA